MIFGYLMRLFTNERSDNYRTIDDIINDYKEEVISDGEEDEEYGVNEEEHSQVTNVRSGLKELVDKYGLPLDNVPINKITTFYNDFAKIRDRLANYNGAVYEPFIFEHMIKKELTGERFDYFRKLEKKDYSTVKGS